MLYKEWRIKRMEATESDSCDADDPDSVSGSLDEEIVSDSVNAHRNEVGGSREGKACSSSNEISELLSNRALESWLDEHPASARNSSDISYVRQSFARISIGDIVLITYFHLRFQTHLSYLSVLRSASRTVVKFIVGRRGGSNETTEPSDQTVTSSSPNSQTKVPSLVPMDVIAVLESGETSQRTLQVHFHHHLLPPLKLILLCNGKKHPVELRPDIGYFVRSLPMDVELFSSKESPLPGMFEYVRRCSFTDHVEELSKVDPATKDSLLVIYQDLASKVLSNANLFLVSVEMPVGTNLDDASGLRLRISGDILSNSIPCLLTITIESKCSEPLTLSVKVHCEETVFGLNLLLNRVVNFLTNLLDLET